jgi:hypothetical protein
LFITTSYVIAIGLLGWEISAIGRDTYIGGRNFTSIPAWAGLGIAGTAIVYGIVRPIFYHRPGINNEDFSTRARIGAAGLNLLLGMGSYTMGDAVGGVIISAGYGIALNLIAWEISAVAPDAQFRGADSAGITAMIGAGVAGLTTIFGIIRPIFYHKPASNSRVAAALKGLNVAVIPDTIGTPVMQLSYRFQF